MKSMTGFGYGEHRDDARQVTLSLKAYNNRFLDVVVYLPPPLAVLEQRFRDFLANRVPGEGGVTLRWLLRVAFGRRAVKRCFREAKDELGLDHYQVGGWRCLHRHFYVTQVSHLFCARIRHQGATPWRSDRARGEESRAVAE